MFAMKRLLQNMKTNSYVRILSTDAAKFKTVCIIFFLSVTALLNCSEFNSNHTFLKCTLRYFKRKVIKKKKFCIVSRTCGITYRNE